MTSNGDSCGPSRLAWAWAWHSWVFDPWFEPQRTDVRRGFRIPSARTIFSTVLPRSLWPGAPGGGQMARVLPTAQPAVQAQPLSAHVSPFFWGGVGRTVSSTFTDTYKSH